MARNIPAALAAHLAGGNTTVCYLLKITPTKAAAFGLTTLDQDVVYDDGTGPLTYMARRGYTAFDQASSADLAVDNSEAHGLLAQYPADGVTLDGIARGDYDGARFVQYLVNYQDLTMGHVIINAGRVGEVRQIDDLAVVLELRSLTQVLRQNALVDLTSITCRATFGGPECKHPLQWFLGTVESVGAENDRVFSDTALGAPGGATAVVTDVPFFTGDGTTDTALLKDSAGNTVTSGYTISEVKVAGASVAFTDDGSGLVTFGTAPASGAAATWSGTLLLTPNGVFAPGVVQWLTGANAGTECDVEEFDATGQTFTLLLPTHSPIQVGDTFQVRRDCDKSKTMCLAYGNYLNFRGEAELPRGNGIDLQAPTPGP